MAEWEEVPFARAKAMGRPSRRFGYPPLGGPAEENDALGRGLALGLGSALVGGEHESDAEGLGGFGFSQTEFAKENESQLVEEEEAPGAAAGRGRRRATSPVPSFGGDEEDGEEGSHLGGEYENEDEEWAWEDDGVEGEWEDEEGFGAGEWFEGEYQEEEPEDEYEEGEEWAEDDEGMQVRVPKEGKEQLRSSRDESLTGIAQAERAPGYFTAIISMSAD
jgi:hypothetical protein